MCLLSASSSGIDSNLLCPCVYVWISVVSVSFVVCKCAANHKELSKAVEQRSAAMRMHYSV